ncbi:MAG: N-acetylmuramoyl-L-alanine amidase [Candidatus Acidoferrum typicum]|nr:N-acetylmuramoyl-L-alanine amidase [Candidatus Acidoferrum typicum]
MLAGQNFFHKLFARVSPVFVALALAFSCAHTSLASEDSDARNNANRREAASTQFARAEDLRAELNSKPIAQRALSEYKLVVSSYRRVYLITPHANEVPDALLAVAELYSEMGDRFGRSYYQVAVDTYKFLVHDYPTSHYGQDAMLRMARLQKDQLGDAAGASKTLEEFLKKYPHSARKREVQESLAEIALLRSGEEAAEPKKEGSASDAGKSAEKTAEAAESARKVPSGAVPIYAAANSGRVPRLRRIGTTASADATRVTIDLEDLVQYDSARIRNPDRIFFDLHAARLTPELARQNIHVEGELLSEVRVAQNQSGIVRVVLNINGVKDYTASLLTNPPQLVIDLYPNTHGSVVRAAKAKRNATPAPLEEPAVTSAAVRDERAGVQAVSTAATRVEPFGPPASAESGAVSGSIASVASGVAAGSPLPTPRNSSLMAPGAVKARSKNKSLGAKSAAADKPDLIQPATAALPTRDGQSTLTRALGLKIGRIVVDAGHGGHDTGTIGPTGLMEKDICLDVALRLGKIIHQRLPAAEVVYTRSDDTFIPLEERTRVANESKADLFISIHANSSHDHAARGIETYYLNLKGSPDAMEVAARENATAQESIHDLEDIVKKIARSEKIDESREFAADIQESLAKRIQKLNRTVKDRGVRKAPFVVLVGADMPSILTEISFLSNPADEQLLKKPEHRQRVAEGLYQGVANYLQSLNSMTMIVPGKSSTPSSVSASVEQSRNQR